MSGLNGNSRFALGVTLETFPLQVGTTVEGSTATNEITTSTPMTTTEPLPAERCKSIALSHQLSFFQWVLACPACIREMIWG